MKFKIKKIIKLFIPYGAIFVYDNYLKNKLHYYFIKKRKLLQVFTVDETLDKIISDNCSIIRFGDGEMDIITGKSIRFQEYDLELSEKLKKILENGSKDKMLVGVPDMFSGMLQYTSIKCKKFWIDYCVTSYKDWEKLCASKKYYNTFMSRIYFLHLKQGDANRLFQKIKLIWTNKEIVLIEGKLSRMGCENDLFNNAKSVERIICPSRHAYSKYDLILKKSLQLSKNKLILVSLGPSAKPLVEDLYQNGFQAIDIGHIDIEYEWWLTGATEKIPLKNKYVNEAKKFSGEQVDKNYENAKYIQEIIAEIS